MLSQMYDATARNERQEATYNELLAKHNRLEDDYKRQADLRRDSIEAQRMNYALLQACNERNNRLQSELRAVNIASAEYVFFVKNI